MNELPKEVKRDIIGYIVSDGWADAVLQDVESTYPLYEERKITEEDVAHLERRMREILFAALEEGKL